MKKHRRVSWSDARMHFDAYSNGRWRVHFRRLPARAGGLYFDVSMGWGSKSNHTHKMEVVTRWVNMYMKPKYPSLEYVYGLWKISGEDVTDFIMRYG